MEEPATSKPSAYERLSLKDAASYANKSCSMTNESKNRGAANGGRRRLGVVEITKAIFAQQQGDVAQERSRSLSNAVDRENSRISATSSKHRKGNDESAIGDPKAIASFIVVQHSNHSGLKGVNETSPFVERQLPTQALAFTLRSSSRAFRSTKLGAGSFSN